MFWFVLVCASGRSKKYRKVSIFKKATSHDDGGSVSKGSGRGKKKTIKDKKPETVEVHDVVDQSTTVIVRVAGFGCDSCRGCGWVRQLQGVGLVHLGLFACLLWWHILFHN